MKFEIKHGFLKNGFSLGISWGPIIIFTEIQGNFKSLSVYGELLLFLKILRKRKRGKGESV